MLNVKSIQILLKITSKLDFTPVFDVFKDEQIFSAVTNKKEALDQITPEKLGEIAVKIIGALIPQLDTVAEFLPELIAAYKGIPIDEAEQLDAMEALSEVFGDKGVRAFFKRAPLVKIKQKLSAL
jgi:hypothetical protein